MKKLHVALLAPRNSVHTVRWANGLVATEKAEITLISQHDTGDQLDPRVKVELLPFQGAPGYFLNVPSLRRILKRISPDLLHIHYASGYGTLGALSGFRPRILSVWGSDVYEFPDRSPLHRLWLKRILSSMDLVCSTSHSMAQRTAKFYRKTIEVIPFGVDLGQFKPSPETSPELGPHAEIILGTMKMLDPVYGIDTLLAAFSILKSRRKDLRLRLWIGGSGPAESLLRQQAKDLGIAHAVAFIGRVPNNEVPAIFRKLRIACFLSRSESFGVAAVEAGACGIPVVASDVSGFKEVLNNGETGLLVPRNDPAAAADALEKILNDPALGRTLASKNLSRIQSEYDWRRNLEQMTRVYTKISQRSSAARR